jgi:hypothetical protein
MFMKKNIAVTILAVLLCTLFVECHIGTSGSWVNDNIDKQVRDEIRPLNDKLLKAITTNNVAAVSELSSPILLEKAGKDVGTIVNGASAVIKNSDYDVVDEYYTKNTSANITNTLMPTRSDDNSYTLNYLALNKEMYVSLLMPKDPSINFIVLAIYGKYNNGWKLNILSINQYKVFNKTAVDYYNDARKNYDKGYLIDAANLMFIASKISTPGAAYFKYKKDDEMKSFYQKAIQEANTKYNFPITIQQIKTKPQVFGIEPQLIANEEPKGIFSIIRYKSAISVADTIAIKAENKEMQKVIGTVFKGIDQNRPVIIYQAYNQIPDGKAQVRRFGMIQKFK